MLKMMVFIFHQGTDGVVVLDEVRQGMITTAGGIFSQGVDVETSRGHRMHRPFGVWS